MVSVLSGGRDAEGAGLEAERKKAPYGVPPEAEIYSSDEEVCPEA